MIKLTEQEVDDIYNSHVVPWGLVARAHAIQEKFLTKNNVVKELSSADKIKDIWDTTKGPFTFYHWAKLVQSLLERT